MTFCLLWIILPIVSFAENRVAILNLKNEAGLKSIEISFLSNIVREVFSKVKQKNQLHIMTRENISALLDKPLAECISENECEITLGRNLHAQILVTGDILKIEDIYRFFLRIYDVKSAKLLGSESGRAINIDALEKEITSASIRLAENIKIADSKDTPIAQTEIEKTKTTPRLQSDLVGETIGITQAQILDQDIKQAFGITDQYAMMVLQIKHGSEAELAGLKVEDIFLMNQISSLAQLDEYLRSLAFYETAKFTYLRNVDGEQKRFEVHFMKRPYLLGYSNGHQANFFPNMNGDGSLDKLPLSQYLQTKYKLKEISLVHIDSINQKVFNLFCHEKKSYPAAWDAHYKDHRFFIRITVQDRQNNQVSHFVNLIPNQYYVWDRFACQNYLY